MKLSIDALLSDPLLIENDKKICERIRLIENSCDAKTECKLLQLPHSALRLNGLAFAAQEDVEFFSKKTKSLLSGKTEWKSINRSWAYAFRGDSFQSDLESLCSDFLSAPTRVRSAPAVAMDLETGTVGHRYPDPSKIPAGIRTLEQLVRSNGTSKGASIIAALAWMFFLRMHPFPDGNGRTSRAFINIVFREYGLVEKPIFLLGPIVYANLDVLVENMFRNEIGSHSIAMIQDTLLQYISCVERTTHSALQPYGVK